MIHIRKAITPFAGILFAALSVGAQSHRASVRGVVLDPSAAPMTPAMPQIANVATREAKTDVSGPDRIFVIALLPPGAYRIDVEHQGYKKYVSRLELQINQELWLDVPLALGNVSEEVLVTAPS